MTKDEQWLLEEKYAGIASLGFDADQKRLAKGEPLAYIIGHQPFLGLTIHLDSHPLIPRPETEWWVEQLLASVKQVARARRFEELSQRDGARASKFSAENYASPKTDVPERLTFLDLCAGSGAIGCAALARLPDAHVSFGEIDPAHKATIEKNIRENKLDESRAHIKIGDLFEPFGDMTFDVIAANPPYVPEARELETSVADHEPALALRAGDDGLTVIRRIATALSTHLAPEGVAWIEVDSSHAELARGLFEAAGLTASIRTDQYGAPRVIVVSFPHD